MINGPSRRLVLSLPTEGIAWYDWWIGTIVSIAGSASFIVGTDTIYRLHPGNLIGIPNGISRLKRLVRSGRSGSLSQARNLLQFSETFGYISATKEIKDWINGHTGSFASRLKFALLDKRRRKRIVEDLIRRIIAIRGLD